MAIKKSISTIKATIFVACFVALFGFTLNAQNTVYTWNGSVSSSWDDPGNWDSGYVPAPYEEIVIDSPDTPLFLDRDVMVGNFTVGLNSSIEFESNLVWLSISGNLINLGTMDLDKGIIEFGGPDVGTQQFIIGPSVPTFNILRFHGRNNEELVLLTDINLKGALIPRMGTIDFNGFDVNLLSGESFQGAIGRMQGGIMDGSLSADELSGVITYNRYYPAGNASWRMLCTPITNASFEDWNDDIPTTGFDGADYPTYPSAENPWSNIRTYNEAFFEGVQADKHFGFESINSITDPIDNQIGYFVYFTPSPTTIDTKGTFFKGRYEPTLTYTASDSGMLADGWNLLANPYPCAITWDGPQHLRSSLDDAIYAYDPNLRQYSSYVNGVSTGMLTNVIGSGQAFWVKANAPDPYVKFEELHKDNSTGVHMKQNNQTTEALVYVELTAGSAVDKCVFGFNQTASGEFDSHLDAYKFYGPDPDLPTIACYSENGDVEMSIGMYPMLDGNSEIDLKIKPGNKSTLTLRNTLVDSYDGNFCFLLKDNELNTILPFNEGDEYEFSVNDPAEVDKRFSIVVQGLSYASVTPETCPDAEDGTATVNGFGEAPWDFIWKDEMNATVHESMGLLEPNTVLDLAPGFYEVFVQNTQEQCNSASVVVQIPESQELDISADAITASCDDGSKAGIKIDINDDFEWDFTIEDDQGKFLRQLTRITSDTIVSGLEIGSYSVRAMSSCGNGMQFHDLNLKDPFAVSGEMTTDQPNNETYVGMPIQFRYSSDEKVEVEWTFENGKSIIGQSPLYTFSAPGEYKIEALVKTEQCKSLESLMIKVKDLTNNDGQADEDDLATTTETPQIGLSIVENALQIEFSHALNGPILFSIFNNNGQTILEGSTMADEMTNHQLDLSGLSLGIYYLNVNDASGLLFSEKFICTQ